MNASQSAFYDMGTIMLLFFNSIFIVLNIFYFNNLWLFLLSLLLMFVFVLLRRKFIKAWDREFPDLAEEDAKEVTGE